MAVPVSILRGFEIFNVMSDAELDAVAPIAEEARYEAGEYIFRPGMPRDKISFVKTGVVGQYVQSQHGGELIPTEVSGPGKVIGVPALFERGVWLGAAMALMPCTLVSLPARRIQAMLLNEPGLRGEMYEGALQVYHRLLGTLVRALTAEDVSVTVEERCPSERSTHMVLSANTRNGQVRALCQREFSCSMAEGKGCPIAEKPAHEFHEIAPGCLRLSERLPPPPAPR